MEIKDILTQNNEQKETVKEINETPQETKETQPIAETQSEDTRFISQQKLIEEINNAKQKAEQEKKDLELKLKELSEKETKREYKELFNSCGGDTNAYDDFFKIYKEDIDNVQDKKLKMQQILIKKPYFTVEKGITNAQDKKDETKPEFKIFKPY
jgi:hypothetical protein